MSKEAAVIFSVLLSLLTGCSAKTPFYANGGSRADGTVDMAYDTELFVNEVVNPTEAETIATQKCKVWGYESAEPFGGQTEKCFRRNGYGDCLRGQMIIKYQCIGDLGTPSSTPTPETSTAGQLTKEQYKKIQLDELLKKNLPYDEYQRQYKAITSQ